MAQPYSGLATLRRRLQSASPRSHSPTADANTGSNFGIEISYAKEAKRLERSDLDQHQSKEARALHAARSAQNGPKITSYTRRALASNGELLP